MVFMKNPASLALSGEDVIIPSVCRDPGTGGPAQVDFEAELAVILALPCKDATREQAKAAILGYTCANDVSARWWQKTGSGGQFCRGKSFDTFCPLGPRLVPQAELDPADLRVMCRVNGATMQDARTSQMMFSAIDLVAELSRGTTLLPGTVLLTGTPAGVGMARTPPVYLKHHDVVEVEIEGIGTLRNRVIDA
jgi:2-keto-4-pentenoate hydratase/2-oxohepta-3-ene-1,7-dioic acid hydratase in catechol pathway